MQFVWADGGRHKYYKYPKYDDYIIRAIATATGMDYMLVNKELSYANYRQKNKGKDRLNYSFEVYSNFLSELGWEYVDTSRRHTPLCLVESDLPKGTLIVKTSGHLTVVRNGKIYDTENPSFGGYTVVDGYFRRVDGEDEEILQEKIKENFAKQWRMGLKF